MSIEIASDQELAHIDEMLSNLNFDISVSMAYVKRAQGWSLQELGRRFSNLSNDSLKRYMQQSYPSMRPIHVVAAYSWVTMVPMTSFYYGLKIREAYRGMDHDAVEAIMRTGRVPTTQFNIILELIYNFLDKKGQKAVDTIKDCLTKKYGDLNRYDDNDFFPPDVIDMNKFAEDYYRSVAITVKRFRQEYNIPIETMAKVLGLSMYQYKVLEQEDNTKPFSMSIGFRAKLGFKINGHVSFTKEMTAYPEFHTLRVAQHIRDLLIVEALRHLPMDKKVAIINILKEMSGIYLQKKSK